jgi:hypothetical protein
LLSDDDFRAGLTAFDKEGFCVSRCWQKNDEKEDLEIH